MIYLTNTATEFRYSFLYMQPLVILVEVFTIKREILFPNDSRYIKWCFHNLSVIFVVFPSFLLVLMFPVCRLVTQWYLLDWSQVGKLRKQQQVPTLQVQHEDDNTSDKTLPDLLAETQKFEFVQSDSAASLNPTLAILFFFWFFLFFILGFSHHKMSNLQEIYVFYADFLSAIEATKGCFTKLKPTLSWLWFNLQLP